ncbi:PREDICTED: low affinity immunoglobulin gamma Fc region receptor II-like [Poecilia mexicana]|uniref:low affinity immunoglobulin gamma Fc region receptor II-like n=1 Tax=Poecilia mexicana TaxID=48701 RepID=UPI00072E7A28|nr:PREDICTED: low affinity immunoglobulin gamma Fc region receptor II-like [Poecilia mexicana]XP_016520964.1 PREDICTED: low affinity immunoglobulin gamma Fc region receptor II-like [Poecilia formosa]
MENALLCMLGFFFLSNLIYVNAEVSIKPTVTLKSNWSQIFRGETVTLRCEIIEGEGVWWWAYEWRTTNRNSPASNELKVNAADRDTFSCRGRGYYKFTQWTNYSLTVSANKPLAKLTASDTIIPAGGSVTLTCSVSGSDGWKFDLLRRETESHTDQFIRTTDPDGVFIVSDEGVYSCRGGRGDPVFYTETSDEVTVSSPFNSLFPAILIVGPVVGIVLIILFILLILLWRCRRSKDLSSSGLNQPESINPDPGATQNDGSVSSSLLPGDSSPDETIQLSQTSGNDSAERIPQPAEDSENANVDQGK